MENILKLRQEAAIAGDSVKKLKDAGSDPSDAVASLLLIKQKLSEAVLVEIPNAEKVLDKLKQEGQDITEQEELIKGLKGNILEDKKAKKKREKEEKARKKAEEAAKNGSDDKQVGEKKEGLSKKELNKLKKKQQKEAAKAAAVAPPTGDNNDTNKSVNKATSNESNGAVTKQQNKSHFPLMASIVSLNTGLGLVKGNVASLSIDNGVCFHGDETICRYLARKAHEDGKSDLYGETSQNPIVASSQIDQWIEFAKDNDFENKIVQEMLNSHLLLRTYISGHELSLADVAIWSAFVFAFKNDPTEKLFESKLVNIHRWALMLKSTQGFIPPVAAFLKSQKSVLTANNNKISKATSAVNDKNNGMGAKKKQQNNNKLEKLPPFKNAEEGKVVTRFPPEPSGHLHIGHVKAMFLNKYYADRYKGKMLLRFDDTNPSKEKVEFEEGILSDIKSLGVIPHSVSHTSDHFELIINITIKMIQEGNAYMDNASAEEMSSQRMKMEDTPSRDASNPSTCLPRFFAMLFGKEGVSKSKNYGVTLDETQVAMINDIVEKNATGESCLRAKVDMELRKANHGNKALYDPVIFRQNLEPHARTGTKYQAYPTYDLACPIVDSHEGVTHAMRDIQYRDRAPLYLWMFKILHLRPCEIHDFSRMNFNYTLLSKRKLKWFVENNRVPGWDDPRFPTVKGVIRRGMQIEALFDFMIAQGASKNIVDMEWDKFWNLNKKYIDPVAPRFNGISKEGKVSIKLFQPDGTTPLKETFKKTTLLPKDTDGSKFGFKNTPISETVFVEHEDLLGSAVDTIVVDEKIVLLNFDIINITKVVLSPDGKKVVEVHGKTLPESEPRDFKACKKKIQWVANSSKNVNIVVHEFDFLVKNKKPEGGEDAPKLGTPEFEKMLRNPSEASTMLIAEPDITLTKLGSFLQLNRRGYFRFDHKEGETLHLFQIPDGKQKAMSTLSTKLEHR